MSRLNVRAFVLAVTILDLVLHPSFHLWVTLDSQSYESMMGLFVAGLHLDVTEHDTNARHILTGTLVEAACFAVLALAFASLYNGLVSFFERRVRS